MEASEGLRFPSRGEGEHRRRGAGIVKFALADALAASAKAGELDFGVDHTALVQEFVPARGGHITRVETLGGKYLYAIKVLHHRRIVQPLPGRHLPAR